MSLVFEKTTTTTTSTTTSTRAALDGAKTTLVESRHETKQTVTVINQISGQKMDRSKPFGRFEAPVSTDAIVSAAINLGDVLIDRGSGRAFHLEARPAEGRVALVGHGESGQVFDILAEYSLRTSVHEYGGAPVAVRDSVVVFTATDKRVYKTKLDGNYGKEGPVIYVTPANDITRYADFNIHPSLQWAVAIQESHLADGNVINAVVKIPLNEADTVEPTVIVSGRDFYTCPRFSADGLHLTWIEWNLPEMPWTCSSLHLGKWDNALGVVRDKKVIAEGDFSVSQPRWNPFDGNLYYANDSTGYYNLYCYNLNSSLSTPLLSSPHKGDFSEPDWTLGAKTYDFLPNGKLIAAHSNQDGTTALSIVDPKSKTKASILPGITVKSLVVSKDGAKVLISAGSTTTPMALSELTLSPNQESITGTRTISVSAHSLKDLDPDAWISVAEPIEFPTEDSLTAYGFFYPPKNANHKPPNDSDLPPLIVVCHGGPTSAANTILSPSTQFWTWRGFAVFHVNYGGSSGYGREYRDRLNGKWGIVDVNDACNAALYLAKNGRVDGKKMAITGGSAGGYTALAVSAFKPNIFSAAASKYGICDLKSLSELTHKFESRYLDIVLGTTNLSAEEIQSIYRTRSPLYAAERIKAPLLILQGSDDRVVPKNQADLIVETIRKRGGIVSYELFEGEGHGWRQASNIKRALEVELEFYLKSFEI